MLLRPLVHSVRGCHFLTWLLSLICLSLPLCTEVQAALSGPKISQQNNPEYHKLAAFTAVINRQFENSRSVVEYILTALEEKKLPSSLILLPMLESSYQPDAVSPAKSTS